MAPASSIRNDARLQKFPLRVAVKIKAYPEPEFENFPLFGHQTILVKNSPIDAIMSKRQCGLALNSVHRAGKETPYYIEIFVLGKSHIVGPTACVFIAGRATGVFPRARFLVHRDVLPVPIPTDDIHVLLLRDELPEFIAFMLKILV